MISNESPYLTPEVGQPQHPWYGKALSRVKIQNILSKYTKWCIGDGSSISLASDWSRSKPLFETNSNSKE